MIPRVMLIDSSVPLYALGAQSVWRDGCRGLLAQLANGSITGLASTEMIQEVAHHRLRMTGDHAIAVADARDIAQLVTLVPFDEAVLNIALELIERGDVRGRDAVHAATALLQGITAVASTDPAFDEVPGLTRIDPTH